MVGNRQTRVHGHDLDGMNQVAEKKQKTHEVLARKYRPQTFGDVVAQQHVTQTLTNAIKSGRIAQAYLFVGPRGVGKTTLARIYAKALNCEKGPTPEPCDRCDLCRAISEGRSLDVIEFDAASNTQVDRIREIILDHISYAPSQSRYKVFIIDEVHMLSVSSFNALLKSLEEPPAHVRFVFATTEPQKIPATILSRCQRFDLRRIPTVAIVATLEKIAKLEGVQLKGDAALAVARGAEGGLRDAESALDQLIAFCGDKITEADVLSVFGLVAWHSVQEMATALLTGDVATLLRHIAEMDEAGKDLQRLSVEILEYFRDLLVVAYTGEASSELREDKARVDLMREQTKLISTERLARITDILIEIQAQLRYALSRRTLLELALVRAARTATSVTLDDVLTALAEAPQEAGAAQLPAPTTSAAPRATPAPLPAAAPAPPAPIRPRVPPAPPAALSPEEELRTLLDAWPAMTEKAGSVNPLIRSALKDATLVAIEEDHVRISFDPEFEASRDKLQIPRNLRVLQKLIEEQLRRPVAIDCVLGAAPAKPPAAKADAKKAESAAKPASARDPKKNEAIRNALETFNGEIID